MHVAAFHANPMPASSRRTPGADPLKVLGATFGHASFRPGQEDVVRAVLAGRDVLAVMPTGGGKSVCYQAPALCLPGLAVVVSPLLALMRDQADALRARGVRAAALVSGDAQPGWERSEIERAIFEGSLDILYVSPERLSSRGFLPALARAGVSLVAVDEAHCVSEWGHDFRPDYLMLPEALAALPSARRMALTATATPGVRSDIVARLLRPGAYVSVGSFARPTLSLSVAAAHDPLAECARLLREGSGKGPAIAYCRTRADTERLADAARSFGLSCEPYHAGMADIDRKRVQDDFLANRISAVAATSAFGMGVDKPDVRCIYHAGLPSSIEAYYQETGRAGRDGAPASAALVWAASEIARRTSYASKLDEAQRRREHARLEQVLGYVETPGCRAAVLSRRFGEDGPTDCGRCDRCLRPSAAHDCTREVFAVLGVVRRLGQVRMSMVAGVLSGSSDAAILSDGLHRLPEYGILRAIGSAGARRLERQCVGLGLLEVDDATAFVSLGVEAKYVLDGAQVFLPDPARRVRTPTPTGLPVSRMDLWERLVDARARIASARGVRPSDVAADAALAAVVAAGSSAQRSTGDSELDREADAHGDAALPSGPVALDTGLF